MKRFIFAAMLGSALTSPTWANNVEAPQSATTTEGERIILNTDGSWQYADDAKAVEKNAAEKEANNSKDCPSGSQGGWFGTRCIPPGDKDFNRGSLSGKGR